MGERGSLEGRPQDLRVDLQGDTPRKSGCGAERIRIMSAGGPEHRRAEFGNGGEGTIQKEGCSPTGVGHPQELPSYRRAPGNEANWSLNSVEGR